MRVELSPKSLNHSATVSQALLVELLGSGELNLQVIDSTTTEGEGIQISLGEGSEVTRGWELWDYYSTSISPTGGSS